MNNDLHQLDLSTLAWSPCADAAPPPGRALASFAAADDAGWLLLFGGVLTGSTLQDVFRGGEARPRRATERIPETNPHLSGRVPETRRKDSYSEVGMRALDGRGLRDLRQGASGPSRSDPPATARVLADLTGARLCCPRAMDHVFAASRGLVLRASIPMVEKGSTAMPHRPAVAGAPWAVDLAGRIARGEARGHLISSTDGGPAAGRLAVRPPIDRLSARAGSMHTQASINTMRFKGRDSASGIGGKSSIIRPGAAAVDAP
jgi:hypothetical protein